MKQSNQNEIGEFSQEKRKKLNYLNDKQLKQIYLKSIQSLLDNFNLLLENLHVKINKTSKQDQIKQNQDDNCLLKKIDELGGSIEIDSIKHPAQAIAYIEKQKKEYEQRMIDLELNYIMLNDPVQQLVFVEIIQRSTFSHLQLKFIKDFVCQFSIFKNNQKFNEQSKELDMKLLLKHLKLEKFEKRQVIFEYGELGQKYYMLLKGKVLLFIPKGIESYNQSIKVNLTYEDEQHYKKKFPDMFNKKEILPGESFGEISLLTNQTRTATMVCGEESWLLTLNKEGFDKLISNLHSQQISKNTQFLQRFEMIQCLSNNKVHSMLHNITAQRYSYNNIIYREGQQADKIYFIKSGTVEISKLSLIQQGLAGLKNSEENQIDTSQVTQPQTQSQKLQKLYSLNRNNKISDNIQKYKRVKIAILTENSYFGHQEVDQDFDSNKIQIRYYQAKCISEELELMVIQKKVFFYLNFLIQQVIELIIELIFLIKVLLQYLRNSKDGLQIFFQTQQKQIEWKDQNLKDQIKILSLVKNQNLRSQKSESNFQSSSQNNLEQTFIELEKEATIKLNSSQKREFYLNRKNQSQTLTKNFSLKSFSQENSHGNQNKQFELSQRFSLKNQLSHFFSNSSKTQEFDQNLPQIHQKLQQYYSNDETNTIKIHSDLHSPQSPNIQYQEYTEKLEKACSIFSQSSDKFIKQQYQKCNIFKFIEGEQNDTSISVLGSPNQKEKSQNSFQIKDFMNYQKQTSKDNDSFQNSSLQEEDNEEEQVDYQPIKIQQSQSHNSNQQKILTKSYSYRQKFKPVQISSQAPIKSNSFYIHQKSEPGEQQQFEVTQNNFKNQVKRKKSHFSSSEQLTPLSNRKHDLLQSISQIGKQQKQLQQKTESDQTQFNTIDQNTNKDYFNYQKNQYNITERRINGNQDSDLNKNSPVKMNSPYYFYNSNYQDSKYTNRQTSQQLSLPTQIKQNSNKNKSNTEISQQNNQSTQSPQLSSIQAQDMNSYQLYGEFKQQYAKNLYYITSLKEQIFETINRQNPQTKFQGLFYDINLDQKQTLSIKKQKLEDKFSMTTREDQQNSQNNEQLNLTKMKISILNKIQDNNDTQGENQKKQKIFSDLFTQSIKNNVIKNRKTMFHLQIREPKQDTNNNQKQEYDTQNADYNNSQLINQLSQFPIFFNNAKKQKIFPQTARVNFQNNEINQIKYNFSKSPR